jgi:biotin carboxyl carrier protein
MLKANQPPAGVPPGSAALLRLQAATLAHTEFDAAAVAFCSEMADLVDASRVSLGLIERRHSQLIAVSRGEPERLDPQLRKQLLAAMDEAYDQGSTIVAPAGSGDRRINRSAETLRREHRGTVITVPIAVHQETIGALTLEFAQVRPILDPLQTLAEDAAALFGPVLFVLRRNERSLIRRSADGFVKLSRTWPHLLRSPWRWLAGALLLAVAALAFIPARYSVSAPARIEGAVQRVVAAPANGFLKSNSVRPGDSVKQGQVLVELLDRDLQLDRSKLQGEMAQHENAYAAAMARSDRSNMMIYQAKVAEARAQSDLIEQQLKRIQMQSPIDGVVIQGDLSQMLGSPVEKGQVLMTIAPRNAFRVIVELDERDVQAVKVGQNGRLVLSALPWDTVAILIERITPMAVVIDGRNVFEIEARLAQAQSDLRPGLRGVARIEVGQAPLARVWTRRFTEHLRRFIWRWSP